MLCVFHKIQAVQELTFAVPLVSFLVDWPVGTVFIAVAFSSFEHMVEAHPVQSLTLVGASVLLPISPLSVLLNIEVV